MINPRLADPGHTESPFGVDELVRSHLPLIGHLVRELHGRMPSHVDRDELMGAGLAALVRSASAWDAEHGVSFRHFASTRVRGAMLDTLLGLDWGSHAVRRRVYEIDQTRARAAVELGHNPSDAELAQAAGLSTRELRSHHGDVTRSVVLSTHASNDDHLDGLIHHRTAAPDTLIERREQIAHLHDAVETLPMRLRAVVEATFFQDRTLGDVAIELGVSESRACQLRAEALELLGDAMNHALDPERTAWSDNPGGRAGRRRETYGAEVAAHRPFRERATEATAEPHVA